MCVAKKCELLGLSVHLKGNLESGVKSLQTKEILETLEKQLMLTSLESITKEFLKNLENSSQQTESFSWTITLTHKSFYQRRRNVMFWNGLIKVLTLIL